MKESFFKIVRADFRHCIYSEKIGLWAILKAFWGNESLIYLFWFRFSQLLIRRKIPLLPLIAKIILKMLSILLGIKINIDARIGKGFRIWHFGGIFVGPVDIGKYCSISPQVIIGIGGRDAKRGYPKIGDYVNISAGAKIFGRIKIGNNVLIGVNTVVSKDIGDNAVVVGIPGKVVMYQKGNPNIDTTGDDKGIDV